MAQAAAWLVRIQQDFSRSIVVLSAVRNVKYASFVAPGDTLRCQVEAIKFGDDISSFKGTGYVDERRCVSGKLELRSFNLADKKSFLIQADQDIITELKKCFEMLHGPEILGLSGGS